MSNQKQNSTWPRKKVKKRAVRVEKVAVEVTGSSPLQHTIEVLQALSKKSSSVILFYSGGKDSIVLLDFLCNKFKRVVCCYMAFIPNMSHNKKYLDYAKSRGAEVREYPHWMTANYISENYMRPYKKKIDCGKMKLGDIENIVRHDTGIDWLVYGSKKSDSMNRRLMLGTFENDAIDNKGRRVYPLSRWTNKMCFGYIKMKNLPMPISYTKNRASQGMDIDKDFLLYLKNNNLEDLNKLLQIFPFALSVLHDENNQASKV